MDWSHVKLITSAPAEYRAPWYCGNGWYFIDECTQLIGRYHTRLEAHEQYKSYCKWLNSEQHSHAGE